MPQAALSRAKRRQNIATSRQRLDEAGVPYTIRNGGAHLVVAARFEFTPGNGVWWEVGTERRGRGVFSLIKTVFEQG